ncbi:MAG TPA: SCO family protein [Candidatus Binatia bacterium]
MKQPWAWVLVAFLVAGIATMALWTRRATVTSPNSSAARVDEGLQSFGKVPPFSLTERSGETVQTSDLSGKVWIADFIYTNCTDTCPLQSAEMKRLQERFAGEPDLRLVSFSVDPKRDTPAVLTQYAARFGADASRWLFLTGPEGAVRRLAENGFHLAATEIANPNGGEPEQVHSPRFALVDRGGDIRGYYNSTEKEALARLGRDAETLFRRAG